MPKGFSLVSLAVLPMANGLHKPYSRARSRRLFARGQGGFVFMGNSSESFTKPTSDRQPLECEEQLPEDWGLARVARVNLLLIHNARPIDKLLAMIAQDLPKPVTSWRPGEPLTLPAPGRNG